MFFGKDEVENRRLVSFYSVYTSLYFPLLLLVLYWTGGIYSAGKYAFNSVIVVIIIAELVKFIGSALYLKTSDINLSKKYDDKTCSVLKNMCNKTKFKEGFKTMILVCLMMFVYFVVAILYGAELFSKYEETFMFSSLLSVLTVFPACLNLGTHSVVALILGGKPINIMENLICQNLYLTVLGAWLGAFVIPLDWDRPWQVWPIPCSLGAMIGFALSHVVMMFKVKSGSKKKSKKTNFS